MPVSLILINSEPRALYDIYCDLESRDEIIEAKMSVGSHDVVAFSRYRKEEYKPEDLHQEIENLQGVVDTTSIHGIKEELLKSVATKRHW